MVKKIPNGCDQQGRYPEAAHAASEVTDDDMLECVGRTVLDGILVAAIVGVVCLTVYLLMPRFN